MSIKYNGGYIPAVGADGTTLVADSSTSTGLRYTAGTVQSNPVLNSAFSVWQRGTSISLPASSYNVYTADRWTTATGVNQACTVSRQATGDTTNLPNIQYAARYQRNSGQTGTASINFISTMETINSIPFAGKTVTMSYYARAGANYSAASNALSAYIATGTGTDQNVYVSYTGAATPLSSAATLTTTWQRFTATGTFASTATEYYIAFQWVPTGTAGANDYVEVTGVQIDIGSVALPFRTNAPTLQGELTACQRYYYRLGGAATYETFAQVVWTSTTAGTAFLKTAQTLRTNNPSIEFASLRALVYSTAGVAVNSVSNVTLTQNANGNFFNLSVTAAGSMVTGFTGWIDSNGTTAGYLALSSEL